MPLSAGTRLGPYEVTAPLGAGGMGEVYRARDSKLGREVAIKVLPEEFTQHPDKLARFEREARLLAALNHVNVATLFGLEEAEGKPFLVMELIEGETLAERIARGPIPVDEALTLSQQIAEALEAAHDLRLGTLTLLGGGESRYPLWTPDGARLTFGSPVEGTWDIFETDPFSGAEPQPLLVQPGDQIPWSWHPDGQMLAFSDGTAGSDIWILPRGGEPFVLFETPAREDSATFAPDGRLLAYVSDATGRREVWVQEYPTSKGPRRVSAGGGSAPVWAPRSDGLYYLNLEGDLAHVPITVEPELAGGTPEILMQRAVTGSSDAGFDIAPGGQSFVVMRDIPLTGATVDLILNWFEELKRLAPTN